MANKIFGVITKNYIVVTKSFTLIPFILGFTVYQLRKDDGNRYRFYFAGLAVNIFLMEFRFFMPRSEIAQHKKAIEDLHKAKTKEAAERDSVVLRVYQNQYSYRCMFIPDDEYEKYHETLEGFIYLGSIYCKNEGEVSGNVKRFVDNHVKHL